MIEREPDVRTLQLWQRSRLWGDFSLWERSPDRDLEIAPTLTILMVQHD